MPCRDYHSDDARISHAALQQNAMIQAALCAVLTVLEKDKRLDRMLDSIDFKEAGITRKEVEKWWKNHKKLDAERRAREKLEREKAKLRRAALKKLSPAERKVLGVKD